MNLQDTKKAAWEQLVKTKPRPPVLTDHRLEKLKQEVWEDQHFWWDLLIRHDLRDKLLSELDESIRLHGACCVKHIIKRRRKADDEVLFHTSKLQGANTHHDRAC